MGDGESILDQPYQIGMDKKFKDAYLKYKNSGGDDFDNISQKTKKIIRKPIRSGKYKAGEMKGAKALHADPFVICWENRFGTSGGGRSKDNLTKVYLWVLQHHDIYEKRSNLPRQNPTDIGITYHVRIFYPNPDEQTESTLEDPFSLQSRIYDMVEEMGGVTVDTIYEHEQVEEFLLMEGEAPIDKEEELIDELPSYVEFDVVDDSLII